jgi:hypothetical protein
MKTTHGMSTRPEYRCWQQLKNRCLNPNHLAFPDYGGRGISVDPEWVKSFEAFYASVGPRPSPQHSLDRIDNNRGYWPDNVRWVTVDVQMNNRRDKKGHGERVRRAVDSTRVTNFKHGYTHTAEYRAWVNLKQRCLNPDHHAYANYGGRGIHVDPAWENDFEAFYDHVGPKPSDEHSLDRFPNMNGNYEPGNVRWATKREQNLNRRPTVTGEGHANHKHGGLGTPEYKTWGSIKTRCFNQASDHYRRYGGADITMCYRWQESFPEFLADVGKKPSPKHTLGRIDHLKSYSCGSCDHCKRNNWTANCRWMTKAEQNQNRGASARSGKLNAERVKEIRALLEGGMSCAKIAPRFGVHRTLIEKIKYNQVWVL